MAFGLLKNVSPTIPKVVLLEALWGASHIWSNL